MSDPTPAERTRREGVPALEVELADGQPWGLALPGPRLGPIVRHEPDPFGRPSVLIEPAATIGYPLGVRRLWDDLSAACRRDCATSQYRALRALAVALLAMAHDVELADAEALLAPGHVDLGRIARAIIPAAFGQTDPPLTLSR